MKKKIVLSVLLALIFVFLCSIPALAFKPEPGFMCHVAEEKFPPNTAYIDFLLPIPVDDECYVDFNSENGKKFGISKDSEIVNYCEDGYISYTFHVVDAISNLSPSTSYHIHVSNSVYENNSSLFEDFKQTSEFEKEKYYLINVEYKDENYQKIKTLEKSLDIRVSKDWWLTSYNVDYERKEPSEFDRKYFYKKFKKAKMAYLDKEGNILAVSNAAEIDGLGYKDGHLNLRLSGTEFTSDPQAGPFWIIYDAVILSLIVLVLIGIVVLIVIKLKKRKRNR